MNTLQKARNGWLLLQCLAFLNNCFVRYTYLNNIADGIEDIQNRLDVFMTAHRNNPTTE